MIRIFKLVLLLVVSQVAFGQAPSNYTNINGRYRWIAGMFDSTFHIPKGTSPSLRTGGSTNAGGLFYNTSDSSVYTYTGTQWIKVRGSINPSDTTNKYVTQVYKKNGSDSVFYVKGGIHTWAFNDSTGSPGGGGGGKVYYFNGGVSMGTFGGFTMYELGDTANTGAAANFTRATTGAIANFITDPNKPGLLQIPAGSWTIDAWMSETGSGANHAQVWAVLEKWNGSTITTIATSPIEEITEGNSPNLYTWAISVPTTSLLVTDRIIIQFYITNTNGKTVTLYTQNGYVGEVHTTFTTGIGAINGLTAPAQYLVTGTSGTDFNINSVTATHTFNLPTASATNRGALSSADWTTFNNKISPADTASMLSPYLRKIDTASLSNRINTKLNISDTATMLGNYVNNVGYGLSKVSQVVSADSATLASYFLRRKDSLTSTNLLGYVTRNVLADTASAIRSADAGGTVTSVATNNGTGITGGTFTTSGTIAADTLVLSTRAWRQKGIDSVQGNLTAGLALKLNISDTANMLNPYLRKVDTASLSNRINTKLNISDTATMLGNYVNNVGYGLAKSGQVVRADSATLASYFLRRKDSLTATNLLGYVTGKILADTAAAVRAAAGAGTIGGSGTANRVSKFTASGTIGNSSIVDSSSSVAMSISSAGNIGVGITPSNWATNYKAFQFNNTSLATFTGLNEQANLALNWYADSGGDKYYYNGASSLYQQSNGNHFFYTAPTGTANNSITFSQRFGVYNDGKVAVGLTSSDSLFSVTQGVHLQRGVRLSGLPTGVGTKALRIDANGTLSIADTTTGGGIGGSGTINRLAKFTASGTIGNSSIADSSSSVAMTISSGGNLGIGTTTVNAKLNIYSADVANNVQLRIQQGSRQYWDFITTQNESLTLKPQNSTSTEVPNFVIQNSTGTTRFLVNTNSGNVGINTTTIGSQFQVNGNAAIGYSASTAAPTNGLAVSGNVGIGQNTATKRLEVAGSAVFTGTGFDGTSAEIQLNNTTATTGRNFVLNSINAGGFQIADKTASGATRFIITSGGNVGIGTTAPTTYTGYTTLAINNTTNGGVIDLMSNGVVTGQINNSASIVNVNSVTAIPLAFSTNSTERMRINSTGSVFIGNGETSGTPSLGIISGTGGTGTNIAGAEFRIRGGASTGSGAGGPITFYTSAAGSAGTGVNAATQVAIIDTRGNMGIGVTPIAWTSIDKVLEIGRVGNSIFSGGLNETSITANAYYTTPSWKYGATGAANIFSIGYGSNSFVWRTAASGTGGAAITFTDVMTLNASGNLGIGTTTIGSRLQVNGNAAIGYSASTAAPTNGLAVSGDVAIGTNTASTIAGYTGLTTNGTSGAYQFYQVNGSNVGRFLSNSTDFYLDNVSTGSLIFRTNGASPTERMRITSGGQVTLSTGSNVSAIAQTGYSLTGSNASSLIDLAGTWNTTGNPAAIKLNITNTASGASADLMELQVGGTNQFRVTKGGAIETDNPSGGTKRPWKLGSVVEAGTWTINQTTYVEVEIDGVAYKLALVLAAEPKPKPEN